MTLVRWFRATAVTLACLGCLWPVGELPAAEQPAAKPPTAAPLQDVCLDATGSLAGQAFDAAGQPASRQPMTLLQGSRVVAQTRSDAAGRFVFPQVRGGVYQISNGTANTACRVWTKAAAPPAAQGQVVLRTEAEVVRGQQPISCLFTNPLVVGLIVAAAVAIPLAVHQSRGEEPSGS
jgi:hypothetical protein